MATMNTINNPSNPSDITNKTIPTTNPVLFDFQSPDFYNPILIGKYTSTISLLKSLKFSPDGLFLSTCTSENIPSIMHIFTLPSHSWQTLSPSSSLHASSSTTTPTSPSSSLSIPIFQEPYTIGETIYDYLWYPLMNTIQDTNSCLLLSSSKDHPLQLYNILTHQLIASFRAHNHMDELTSLISLGWSPDGTKIYGGAENTIYIFDINRPGREIEKKSTTTNRSSRTGQKGIISAISIASSSSIYNNNSIYAAGSYKGNLWLYNTNDNKSISICKEYNKYTYPDNIDNTITNNNTSESTIATTISSSSTSLTKNELLSLNTHGITQLQFSNDGMYLFAGRRKANAITCWDMRKLDIPLHHYYRYNITNQKLLFDIDRTNTILTTGTSDHQVYFYNIQTGERIYEMCGFPSVVNGVNLHPSGGVFGCVTGERMDSTITKHYTDDSTDSSSSSDGEEEVQANHTYKSSTKKRKIDSNCNNDNTTIFDNHNLLPTGSNTTPSNSMLYLSQSHNNNTTLSSSISTSPTAIANKATLPYASTLTLWRVNSKMT